MATKTPLRSALRTPRPAPAEEDEDLPTSPCTPSTPPLLPLHALPASRPPRGRAAFASLARLRTGQRQRTSPGRFGRPGAESGRGCALGGAVCRHTSDLPVLPHLALLASLHNRLEDVRRVRSLGDLFAELAKHMDAPKPAGARGNQLFSLKLSEMGALLGDAKPLDESTLNRHVSLVRVLRGQKETAGASGKKSTYSAPTPEALLVFKHVTELMWTEPAIASASKLCPAFAQLEVEEFAELSPQLKLEVLKGLADEKSTGKTTVTAFRSWCKLRLNPTEQQAAAEKREAAAAASAARKAAKEAAKAAPGGSPAAAKPTSERLKRARASTHVEDDEEEEEEEEEAHEAKRGGAAKSRPSLVPDEQMKAEFKRQLADALAETKKEFEQREATLQAELKTLKAAAACQQGSGWERHRPVCGFEAPLLQALHELDERTGNPIRPQPVEECTLRLVLAAILTYEETECESPPPRSRARGDPTFADVLAQVSHDAEASARQRQLARLADRAFFEVLPFEKRPSPEVTSGLINRASANEICFYTKENKRFASAFVPAVALANHSCIPTCVRLCGRGGRGWSTELRTLRKLSAGQELTYSYLPLTMPVRDRRSTLEKQYSFSCDCDRCLAAEEGEEEPMPLEAHAGCGGTLYPYRASAGASVSGLRCSICETAFSDYPARRGSGGGCFGLCIPKRKNGTVKRAQAAPTAAAAAAMPSDSALSPDFTEEAPEGGGVGTPLPEGAVLMLTPQRATDTAGK